MKKILFIFVTFFLCITLVKAKNCEVITGDGTNIGDIIKCDTEVFNVLSNDGERIKMLAQYNVGEDYKQNIEPYEVTFSEVATWENTPGPKEIDFETYGGEAKILLDEYVSYLKNLTNDNTITGTLITLSELQNLECTISSDYSYVKNLTCENSQYASWLINNQWWWTRSAGPDYYDMVWVIQPNGILNDDPCDSIDGVRPILETSVLILQKEITTQPDINGNIEIIGNSKPGDKIELLITPKEGYYLKEVKITDEEGNLITITNNTFIMPNSNIVIEPVFEKIPSPPKTKAKSIITLIMILNILLLTIKSEKISRILKQH